MTLVEALKHISENKVRREGWKGWLKLDLDTGRLFYQEYTPSGRAIQNSQWVPYLQDFEADDWSVG